MKIISTANPVTRTGGCWDGHVCWAPGCVKRRHWFWPCQTAFDAAAEAARQNGSLMLMLDETLVVLRGDRKPYVFPQAPTVLAEPVVLASCAKA